MEALKATIQSLADKIQALPADLPTYHTSEDFAQPHLEQHGDSYHWVVVERGEELERRITTERHELLYWVFDAVTFNMAARYELAHRVEGEDSRIQRFRVQEELLAKIDPEYGRRAARKHRVLLRQK